MAYNTKPIVTDVDGNPISQYYNKELDQYEPVEGQAGANKVVLYNADGTENNNLSLIPILEKLSELTGTVIDEQTRQSNEQQRITFYNQLVEMLNTGQLKGDKGDTGETGRGLEFDWDGTRLGVRVEGDEEYIYVDLRGPQGPPGEIENLTSQHIENALGYLPVSPNDLAAHKADSAHLNIKPCIKKLDTIISAGTSSDWDEAIREIGNVLYDPDDVNKPYKLVYSGYNPPYAENNVYVGYAYSVDCKSWVKGGKLLERSSEDPYLVKHNGMYYLYVEDKEVVPFRNIRLFTSTDFNNWTDRGVVLDIGDGWESQDVSSPVVWVENSTWYMLYEGRSIGQDGAIGLATSTDGIEWTKHSDNPIIKPNRVEWFNDADVSYALNIAPDDIRKVGNVYQLTLHGYTTDRWRAITLISNDLSEWHDVLSTPLSSPSSELMFTPNNMFIYIDNHNICLGVGVPNTQFASRPQVSTTSKTYYIDEVNGDDNNNGESENAAFKTWEKCFSHVPIFLNHNYTINIIGNYSGRIKIHRVFADWGVYLTLKGNTENPDNHVVGEIDLYSCFANDARIACKYLKTTNKGIFIENCLGVSIDNCKPQRMNSIAIMIQNSSTTISYCDFGIDIVTECISATTNSSVLSHNNIGNAKQYGLIARRNGVIGKFGTQPTGTTSDEHTSGGGVIR